MADLPDPHSLTVDPADGAGSMARAVAAFDWAGTPLGPMAGWPPELTSVTRQILESSFPAAIVWGPDYTTIYNDAFRPILGEKPEALGRSFADIWAEVWDDIGPIARRANAGEATYIENYHLTVKRHDEPEEAWFTFCYSPLRLADGTVAGMIDTVVETTETVVARERIALINAELGHRLKNTLTLVQAIAAQSFRGDERVSGASAFEKRLAALGRAHQIIFDDKRPVGTLAEFARVVLDPFNGDGRFDLSGPDQPIGSSSAIALSLILNELATNATKYGALSGEMGRVDLTWSVDDAQRRLRLSWKERDGPPVEKPTRSGFGSRLVGRGLGPGSVVAVRYPAGGFEMTLDAPLSVLGR